MSLKTFLRAGLCAALLAPAAANQAHAQASDSYIGDIIIVGFNFCPRGFARADGQALSVSQNTPLFALYGTTYGGNGQTTFNLPDFRGRIAVHQGQGPGLLNQPIGLKAGANSRTLTVANLAQHTHVAVGSSGDNNAVAPTNNTFADFSNAPLSAYASPANTAMEDDVVSETGGNEPVMTINPSQSLLMCVALQGVFPSRN